MNKIKFSHNYDKMPFHKEDSFEATLLDVFLAETSELSKQFIEYDTQYSEKDYVGVQSDLSGNTFIPTKTKSYPLPNGKVLVLLLWSWGEISKHVWTTIRRWTPEKEAYYRSIRGQTVEIVIESKANI